MIILASRLLVVNNHALQLYHDYILYIVLGKHVYGDARWL